MLPFELTKDTPYLALSGELWSVFCEYFNRNWPCYKGFQLYYDKKQCEKLGKMITSSMFKLLLSFIGNRCSRVLYSKWNYIYWVLAYSVDFKAPQEL